MAEQIKQKIDLNRVTHSVRAAQAVLQYGVGAMVDFPDQTLVTAAPEYLVFPNGIFAQNVEHFNRSRIGLPNTKQKHILNCLNPIPIWYSICNAQNVSRIWLLPVLSLSVKTGISMTSHGLNGFMQRPKSQSAHTRN